MGGGSWDCRFIRHGWAQSSSAVTRPERAKLAFRLNGL
ncbi:hypothetical protein C4K35_0568 [Pseudomonas chlororaphis subsp. piscium]|nr:hypothetical protein C4K35_0568 [Pseudomonas chlororaphis subsp. piscium]AZC54758.1 hypothetical protein C4K34_0564 [Pseudomonas chlororaphis subsp. piscium]AZC61079.1 hypothetical protein C4K33_0558 [Pseudomonas chlororaphis subsp. piscium]AZC67254.1 hypothetical protein C4K32_0563 [Pseudomonas chlororaphis subsp. piscium]AZC73492.1 hypothetical protein C4K31_0560 [Pseudomonas chlororaphis subsp. piscium]